MTALEHATTHISVPIFFRTARIEDLPKLEWYGQFTHYRNLFRRAYREQLLGTRLMLIADSNNFPIGHIFLQFVNPDPENHPEMRRAYLYSLRVMEMFRGYGIGTRLIEEAENIIADRDYFMAVIAVSKENYRARRLYERMGYHVFADDLGNWSYTDHEGRIREVQEPCWLLQKEILIR